MKNQNQEIEQLIKEKKELLDIIMLFVSSHVSRLDMHLKDMPDKIWYLQPVMHHYVEFLDDLIEKHKDQYPSVTDTINKYKMQYIQNSDVLIKQLIRSVHEDIDRDKIIKRVSEKLN